MIIAQFLVTVGLIVSLCSTTASAQIVAPREETPLDVDVLFPTQHPFMSLSGGLTSFSMNGNADFESGLTVGTVLGFEYSRPSFQGQVRRVTQNGAYLTWVLPADSIQDKYSVESWRFGLEGSESFGYYLGDSQTQSVDFGATKSSLSWFVPTFPSLGADSATTNKLARYDGLHFGESARASIGVQVTQSINVSAGFEWAQVYERHMFWYWGMSTIIEGIADGLGTAFVNSVGKSSPLASPILHFVIKNGIAMGFKALRQNQMNWPFTTAAPLNMFNIGASVKVTF
jgi:hypothetical protein